MLTPNQILNAAEKIGTPFYIYDANIIKKQYQTLRSALGGYADIFYSIKANPNIAICQILKSMNAGAEVCSEYEFYAAIKAGFQSSHLIVVGPAKSEKLIRLSLIGQVYAIVCESLAEYKKISDLAAELGVMARVALRINPHFYSKTALLKMGGKPSQFGIDEDIVFKNIHYFKNMPHVKLLGIHVYNGTRILDAHTVYENTKSIFAIAREFSKAFQSELEMVDIGGGIGVPYYDNEDFFDFKKLSEWIIPELKSFTDEFKNARIILESGRLLVAEAGAFVSRVMDVKTSKQEKFIVTDGGTNCHMAAVGIGGVVKRNFPTRLVTHRYQNNASENLHSYHITGPLCTPGDLLSKSVLLEEAIPGDLIVIDRSGAYGPTASPVNFLSHGYPSEVLIDQENIQLIRRKDSLDDFFQNQIF